MLKRNFKILVFALFLSPAILLAQEIDSALINYNLIDSYPQNAAVYVNDELTGNTPLYFMWSDSTFPKTLRIKYKGYIEESETLNSSGIFSKKYILKPSGRNLLINPVKADKNTHFETKRKVFPIVLSSLVTAGSGIAAFYFKSEASKNQKNFDIYGDPAELDKKKDNNLIGNISIVALQLGFGALMYFLFLD
ncbi:MAG: PEGA domain-containing protein [Ignavibacteria bacterium]|nr:PEGA domain-containing protein [Ignavibacteria bacterium]